MASSFKPTVPVGRRLVGNQKGARQAFSQRLAEKGEAAARATDKQEIVRVTVECEESDIITEEGSEQFHALLTVLGRDIAINGPERDTKPEAIKDGDVMNKAYQAEGELGVKRVAQRLERKKWTRKELESPDDSFLDGLLVANDSASKLLIPKGEGWTRYDDDKLWEPRSKVYFVQTGSRMGQYLKNLGNEWQEVDVPHTGFEYPVNARASGANVIRRGAKLERTVLLNELPKIARLALKFPLSFLDSPASAYALFQGIRSAESADWCAKNFHSKLIPQLATKIHKWETLELQDVLKNVLRDMDAELLKSTHAFSACSAVIALLLGDRLVISGVGQIRVALLFDDGSTKPVLACTSDPTSGSERERIEGLNGIIHNGLIHHTVQSEDAAQRILRAKHDFEVLQIEPEGPADEKQLRTAYRKLALRVHPDKIQDDSEKEVFHKAFARLESSKEALEKMLVADSDACRALHRVLRCDVHTRDGAGELLNVDKTASTDTDLVSEAAQKSAQKLIASLKPMEGVTREHDKAVSMCKEAVETLRRPCSSEALPRHEAMLRMGLPTSRAMGARDLRFPVPILLMEPQSSCLHIPTDRRCRLAMMCGATASLTDQQLHESSANYKRMPKASALRWCLDTDPSAATAGAVCIGFDVRRGEKRSAPGARSQSGLRAGMVFVRHILFRHHQLRGVDPVARREGAARTPGEAEATALATLDKLIADPTSFVKLCRELSDCQTADNPGNLAGHIGWVGKGEQEPTLEEVALVLGPNDLGDIVTTSRGVHIIQRLG